LTTTGGTHRLYNFMWRWCGQDKWRVKNIPAWHWESFLGFTCLGFYLKRCLAYSIKGWEVVSLNLRSLKSRHCCRRRCSRIRCCHRSYSRRCRFSTTVAHHRRFSHHRRSPPSMVSHRHSPPQPLSHEISLMQMGALDSYHVSNLKFRYLKSNYALS